MRTTNVMAALALACWTAAQAGTEGGTGGWIRATRDAAHKTVAAMEADGRMEGVERVAFVRLKGPAGEFEFPRDADLTQVFESELVSRGGRFAWATHEGHEEEWRLIDGVFDQAADFGDYDPATHPELGKLVLADALLIGQVVGVETSEKVETTERTVHIALRAIHVPTGEEVWGATVEGLDTETHAHLDSLKEEAMRWLTWRNIGILAGAIAVLAVLRALAKAMTRVR